MISHFGKQRNVLLVSRYISKPLKEQLKGKKINYLETAGNCFIKTDDLYIYINDQPVTDVRLPAKGKLCNTFGIKFLFAILNNPNLVNATSREIAKTANTALGNIGGLIEELKKERFLKDGVKEGRKFLFLENKDQPIRRWSEAYLSTIRPKLPLGTYRFAQKEQGAIWMEVSAEGFYWRGESGAAILTKF